MKVVPSVLIVDDSESDVFLCSELMALTGRYREILSASDGAEALALFRDRDESAAKHPGKFPPTLVLLDINMPRMDGFEFLERLTTEKLHARSLVVLMLTTSANARDKNRAEGFDIVADYLTKPPTLEDLDRLADMYGVEE